MVFGRVREKIEEFKLEQSARRKMRNYSKAKSLEDEIAKIRRQYPSLTYAEAKVIAQKNLRRRKWRRRKQKAREIVKRLYRLSRGRRGRW